jgi:hypothetical protein
VSNTPAASLTAVQQSVGWFQAINAKDRSASLAYFTPQARSQGDWDFGDVGQWATFKGVKCRSLAETALTARTYCTFNSFGGDGTTVADKFWSIEWHRASGGPWLITGYGQP